MKNRETLNEPSAADITGDSGQVETQTLSLMKAEFQQFIDQTRERLRIVSEALIELDREFSEQAAAPIQSPPATDVETLDEQESLVIDDVDAFANEPPLNEEAVTWNPAPSDQEEASESELDFWSEMATDADQKPTALEDASTDASFPKALGKDDEAMEKKLVRPKDEGSPYSRPQVEKSIEADSDPFERLNAIKQRLARQIENS